MAWSRCVKPQHARRTGNATTPAVFLSPILDTCQGYRLNFFSRLSLPMPLVTIRDLSIGFRGPLLLDSVDFQIEPRQRIGLVGRNGVGKTTLLRIISGELAPDHGTVAVEPGNHIATLTQHVPDNIHATIRQTVQDGLMNGPGQELEDWKAENQVDQILSRMELDGATDFQTLSSGMKRRVLLARALVTNPDLLLLDEPTNHLDIEAIDWLEQYLLKTTSSLMFVTHDRMFLRKLSTRILEIDRGRIFDWACDYDTFLRRKEEVLAAEEKQNALFDKRLAEEEAWIRQGIKARRTRNEGRVRRLEAMREERRQRRQKSATSQLTIQEGERTGQRVIELKKVSFAYEDQPVFTDFSTQIMRQDKVGIIGRNGAGKTTLLKILLGQLQPTAGEVRMGTHLQIAWFDQMRAQLEEDATVQDNVGEGSDSIEINGNRKHILGYLQDFLFSPERARTKVKFLSGGERNRILLAKLFAKPANLIVLDEPTNDLDAETLELLEEKLVPFNGTVIMVSHDRAFLNNVVTSTIVFEESGLHEYDGGFDDWQRQRNQSIDNASVSRSPANTNATRNHRKPNQSKSAKKEASASTIASEKKSDASAKPRRLSFNEKRELETLPPKIAQIEAAIAELHAEMANPAFYQKAGPQIAEAQDNLKRMESELETAFDRWAELEARN